MSADEEETFYDLVMPFVVLESNGGPYDDASFVAGMQYAMHQAEMAIAAASIQVWTPSAVRSAMLPQYDLLAMDNGFVMTSEPWDDDPEWAIVTFTRSHDDQP